MVLVNQNLQSLLLGSRRVEATLTADRYQKIAISTILVPRYIAEKSSERTREVNVLSERLPIIFETGRVFERKARVSTY